MERKANRHPFENMAPPLPPSDWVVRPLGQAGVDHVRSSARSEDALMAPFGIDVSGAHRDWNEELQSCRELPRATLQVSLPSSSAFAPGVLLVGQPRELYCLKSGVIEGSGNVFRPFFSRRGKMTRMTSLRPAGNGPVWTEYCTLLLV